MMFFMLEWPVHSVILSDIYLPTTEQSNLIQLLEYPMLPPRPSQKPHVQWISGSQAFPLSGPVSDWILTAVLLR